MSLPPGNELDAALRLGDQGVVFALERTLPAWGWALAAILAAALAWWCYRRLTGPAWARALLGGFRWVTLLTLLVLFCGPRLERAVERTEPDVTVFLLDRSASMGIADAPGPGDQRVSRAQQAHDALGSASAALGRALHGRRVAWLGFDAATTELTNPERPAAPDDVAAAHAGGAGIGLVRPEPAVPVGPRSDADAALRAAMARVSGRPVSAIVLFSDGRFSEPVSRQTLDLLARERVAVHAVPLGSPEAVRDAQVVSTEAPRAVFAGDVVPVRAVVRRRGAQAGNTGPLTVRLIDNASGAVLTERTIAPEGLAPPARALAESPLPDSGPAGVPAATDAQTEVVLSATPERSGDVSWSVVVSDADGPDLVPQNDRAAITAGVIDRPLRALYIDGYPRWEQRYLKALMLREASTDVSAILLAADRRSIQEGDTLLDALPVTPEDWAPFDLVVLGDVKPGLFTTGQLEALREHVARRGAGLIWIAGPRATPAAWAGGALADLLPITLDPDAAAALPVWDQPVVLTRTGVAERLGLLALGDQTGAWPASLTDPATGWSTLRWAHRVGTQSVKPAAEVLALASPDGSPASATPAVLTMRYGAGRVGYIATDETWRWRYARGEDLQERFWIPLLRTLARGRLAAADAAAALSAAPDAVEPGSPVRVRLDVLDALLDAALPDQTSVSIERAAPDSATIHEAAVTLTRDPADRSRFTGLWQPDRAGDFLLRPADAALAPSTPAARVRVTSPDDELARIDTDHAALAELARATGGSVVAPDDLAQLAELPNRSLVIEGRPQVRPLWDNAWVLGALLALLALEWIGRRLLRLA